MRCTIFLFLSLVLTQFSFAQTPALSSFKAAGDSMIAQPENYLAPINALNKIKADSTDFVGSGMWLQAMMTYYSFAGDYTKTLFYSDARYGSNLKPEKASCDTAFVEAHTFVDAANYITENAKKYRVVMINEAHHLPFHRAFVLPMLRKFYEAGYRYMPIETLDDSLINQKKYPDFHTGFYSKEPLFGELIREALRIGFKLIRYEPTQNCDYKGKADPNYCNRFRDSLMAVNLSDILKKDPNAKILVYAGYDHIHEGSDNSWKKMAQFFKALTGIDPYTVELTRQVEHLYPQLNSKEFTAVNTLKHITKPVVALKDDKPWHGNFVDVTVIFPAYLKQGKRPSYLSINGLRKLYDLEKLKLKTGQFVQAFYADEEPGMRTPADQIVFDDTNRGLYLFRGSYNLEIRNENGVQIKTLPITVR